MLSNQTTSRALWIRSQIRPYESNFDESVYAPTLDEANELLTIAYRLLQTVLEESQSDQQRPT